MKKSELRQMIREAYSQLLVETVEDDVVAFLKKYPDGNIPDVDVHALSDKMGIDTHKLESVFYKLAAKYANSKVTETIEIPIEIGDTIMTGKFKNKKTVVKTIDKDSNGEITINGKRILRIRIPESNEAVSESIKTKAEKIADYYEARKECEKYLSYKGDKRSTTYKILSHRLITLWKDRMNKLASELGLPNFNDIRD